MKLTIFEERLLNEFQHGFPLESRPFKVLGDALGSNERFVLRKLKTLIESGHISRIGPVFRPNSVGASTLAAISVPTDELESTADIVSSFDAVNHNYEREHAFNLWFVVTETDETALQCTLDDIALATGFPVMSLPMLRAYHIDLGFDLGFRHSEAGEGRASHEKELSEAQAIRRKLTDLEEQVVAVIQSGLPVCERPYEIIAESVGISEKCLLTTINGLCQAGMIKRWGLVVRHHELGYRANAMVVWNIPEHEMDGIARRLAAAECVTLCYQRPRKMPHWPYNLFCMIHGKDRLQVLDKIACLVDALALSDITYDVLFSRRRFKQRGAQYRKRSSNPLESVAGLAHG